MVERLGNPFATKAVEDPEQHRVEAPLVSVKEELLELGPLSTAAAFLVAVLFIVNVNQPLGEGSQLAQLVVVGLALVTGAYAGIDGSYNYKLGLTNASL